MDWLTPIVTPLWSMEPRITTGICILLLGLGLLLTRRPPRS